MICGTCLVRKCMDQLHPKSGSRLCIGRCRRLNWPVGMQAQPEKLGGGGQARAMLCAYCCWFWRPVWRRVQSSQRRQRGCSVLEQSESRLAVSERAAFCQYHDAHQRERTPGRSAQRGDASSKSIVSGNDSISSGSSFLGFCTSNDCSIQCASITIYL